VSRWIAFLRGINLGGRRVKMDELRAHLDALGLDAVDTFLASGNVIFRAEDADAAGLEARIEEHLEEALGFATATFVRGPEELKRIADDPAVGAGEAEGLRPYVVFLRREAGASVADALESLQTPDDRLHPRGSEVLWLRRGGISDTTITPRDFEEAVGGMDHTRRTLNTVRRILAKYAD